MVSDKTHMRDLETLWLGSADALAAVVQVLVGGYPTLLMRVEDLLNEACDMAISANDRQAIDRTTYARVTFRNAIRHQLSSASES